MFDRIMSALSWDPRYTYRTLHGLSVALYANESDIAHAVIANIRAFAFKQRRADGVTLIGKAQTADAGDDE